MPFSVNSKFNIVDLADLAEAVSNVLVGEGHDFATYQLAGPEALSQVDMARIISEVLGRPVFAEAKPVTSFLQAKNGDNKMFRDFFLAMLRQGINLAPSPFESGFISAAHEDEEIKKTLNAANFAFKELAS